MVAARWHTATVRRSKGVLLTERAYDFLNLTSNFLGGNCKAVDRNPAARSSYSGGAMTRGFYSVFGA